MKTAILWRKHDGNLAYTLVPTADDATPEQARAARAAVIADVRTMPVAEGWELLSEEVEAPTDLRFMKAWRWVGGRIVVNMPAARAIFADQLRDAVSRALQRTDAALMDALEQGDEEVLAGVRARRTSLRALPALALDDAATPSALLTLWPAAQLGAYPYAAATTYDAV